MTQRMGEDLALALALEGRVEAATGKTAQLVALADTLAALPDPEIDETWASALEQRLLSDGIEEQMAPVGRPHLVVVQPETSKPAAPALRPNVVRMPKRRVVVRRSVAAVAAAAMLAAFPAAAMASAVPGSPFYGLDRAVERVQLKMFGTPTEDAFTLIGYSAERLSEAQQVAAMGGDAATVAKLISDSKKDTQDASALLLGADPDPAMLTKFQSELAKAERKMQSLVETVSPNAKAALSSAIESNRSIQQDVAEALGTGAVIPEIEPIKATSETSTASVVPTSGDSSTTVSDDSSKDSDRNLDLKPRSRDDRDGDDRNGGNGKNSDGGGGDACEVAGSADGLGDLAAPLTHFTC